MLLAIVESSRSSPASLWTIVMLALFVGVPVLLVRAIKNRKQEKKISTHIAVEEHFVSGVGEIIREGSGFGGVSVGSGGVRPMVGVRPTTSKLRGFKIPYSNIISVDLLVNEPGIVLITQAADYNCYVVNAEAIQEEIVKRMMKVN